MVGGGGLVGVAGLVGGAGLVRQARLVRRARLGGSAGWPARRWARLLRHHEPAIEPSGIGTQAGRFLASYTTSYTALSGISARSSAPVACRSIPPLSA